MTAKTNEHAERVLRYLDDLCDRLDRGKRLVRGEWSNRCVPAVLPLALGVSVLSCGGRMDDAGAPGDAGHTGSRIEICANGIDDDGDGLVDCDDPACSCKHPNCLWGWCGSSIYSAPLENCGNGKDDDGNGLIDCDDPDCAADPLCTATFPDGGREENCSNGVDDNGDGLIDCDDPSCFAYCATAEYAAPTEDCENGLDDDDDGLTDCDDPDCAASVVCSPIPPYGAPPEDCENGVDDNDDGAVDCEDPECYDSPGCSFLLYAAP